MEKYGTARPSAYESLIGRRKDKRIHSYNISYLSFFTGAMVTQFHLSVMLRVPCLPVYLMLLCSFRIILAEL
jgi:hypothetical protein